MKVWVYVEGESDKLGLDALWGDWKSRLRTAGWGIQFIPLGGKPNYFKLIGHRVAEKLIASDTDLVVGLPDLYPNASFVGTPNEHKDFEGLRRLQERLVGHAFNIWEADALTDRFFASALKHDLEMLLLAADQQLKARLLLGSRQLGSLTGQPEDQNQDRPPKIVVSELFQRELKQGYRETKDAPAILRKAKLREVVLDDKGATRCPKFKEMLDWVGEKTGVPAY